MADKATFYQGDRKPYLRVTLERGGAAIPLATASGVTFKLYRKGGENLAPLISAAAVIVDEDTGVVEYQWAADDLDLYGRFSGVFVVDWAGKDEGVPDTGYIDVQVFATGS
jgi:hypothetical protein